MNMEELLAALKALIESAEAEDRPLSEEEEERAKDLTAKIEATKRTAQYRSLVAAYETPVRTDLHVAVSGADEASPELRSMIHYMKTGTYDDYAIETRAQTKGTTTAGGYLVPTTTQAKIIERLKAFGGLADQAETLTTDSGETINWATEDDTGNTAEIVAEGAAAASAGADKVFGQASLGAFKYEATGTGNLPMKVSWELLEDSAINLEDHIADNFARRIARKFSVDICVGTGTGQPQGIVTPQTAFDEIAANAAGPTYGELVGANAALDPEYEANAKWLMHPATWWFLVANLLDASDRPLIQANAASGAGTAIEKRLLGHEVVLDPGMPQIGDQTKIIVFGDLRQSYIIRRVNGFHLLRLEELYAVNGFVGFLGWARMDGRVQNLNSYVVLGSENTA
jgi:HK97 family phage major capsid protein